MDRYIDKYIRLLHEFPKHIEETKNNGKKITSDQLKKFVKDRIEDGYFFDSPVNDEKKTGAHLSYMAISAWVDEIVQKSELFNSELFNKDTDEDWCCLFAGFTGEHNAGNKFFEILYSIVKSIYEDIETRHDQNNDINRLIEKIKNDTDIMKSNRVEHSYPNFIKSKNIEKKYILLEVYYYCWLIQFRGDNNSTLTLEDIRKILLYQNGQSDIHNEFLFPSAYPKKTFKITDKTIYHLKNEEKFPETIINKLKELKDKEYATKKKFKDLLKQEFNTWEFFKYNRKIVKHSLSQFQKGYKYKGFINYKILLWIGLPIFFNIIFYWIYYGILIN